MNKGQARIVALSVGAAYDLRAGSLILAARRAAKGVTP